ncbi:MAG: LysM peptidoglycan-binding domain-containing protein [Actinobacteria bacterium]|nr:LysM peptidoglycan-binding domain-containing protein [Actinomycetota bacterium]
MTKETKVGLVIGLFFIVGVVYLLHWATKPTEFKQPSFYRPEVAYQPAPEPQRNPLPPLSVSNKLPPLPAENSASSSNDIVLPAAATLPPAPPPVVKAPERFYVVQPGQTLSDIARIVYGPQHADEWRRIHQANKYKIPNAHVIQSDLKLLIPPLDSAAATSPQPALRTARTYTVKPGDTLSDIASAKLGSSRRWRQIMDLNRDQLPDEYSLRPGMVLKLPVSSGAKLLLPRTPDDINLSIR